MQATMNPKRTRRPSSRGMGQVLTVTVGLVAMCIVFGIVNPNFFNQRNFPILLRQIAPFLLVGIGQSYVLITGNIDLSIGSVLGMSCMMSATLMTQGMDPFLACLITMAAALLVGVFNGFLVANCKLPPFIGTLGTMTICRGFAQIVNNNMNTDAIGEAAKGFRDLFYYGKNFMINGKLFGFINADTNIKATSDWSFLNYFNIYNTVFVVLAIWFVFNFILGKTRTGRYVYAVGSNMEAAKLSGVNVSRTITTAYLVSAFCASVTGIITCASSGQGFMDAGMSFELYAVASSVIGGVSTLGGQGILLGTIVGASVWGVMQNGLSLAGISVGWRNVIVGVIVIASVLADVLVRNGVLASVRKSNKESAAVKA